MRPVVGDPGRPGSPRTHYLNAGFDLTLRARSRRLARPGLDRQVRELSVQSLLGAQAGDAARLGTEVSGEFLQHLESCGIRVPRILRDRQVDRFARLRPFGWNAEAIEYNQRHARPAEHPALDTVRQVNSRSFSLRLEQDLFAADPRAAVVHGRADLEAYLKRTPASGEWVIKAEHGNAGLGNRRIRGRDLTPTDRDFVDAQFAEDDRMVIEPWRVRERDWCVVFDVPYRRATLRMHEVFCTRDGALVGALFEPEGPAEMGFSVELVSAAERIASRLEHEGYFGPACFDAFSWRDGERLELRILADLNCRRSMSDGAFRLWRQLVPQRTLLYRFFNRRKLELPIDVSQALDALGRQRYDPQRRLGVLLACPPGFIKIAVILVAEDREAVFALEREFRARFEVRHAGSVAGAARPDRQR